MAKKTEQTWTLLATTLLYEFKLAISVIHKAFVWFPYNHPVDSTGSVSRIYPVERRRELEWNFKAKTDKRIG